MATSNKEYESSQSYDPKLKYTSAEMKAWLYDRYGPHMYLRKDAVEAAENGEPVWFQSIMREWKAHVVTCGDDECKKKFAKLVSDTVKRKKTRLAKRQRRKIFWTS